MILKPGNIDGEFSTRANRGDNSIAEKTEGDQDFDVKNEVQNTIEK